MPVALLAQPSCLMDNIGLTILLKTILFHLPTLAQIQLTSPDGNYMLIKMEPVLLFSFFH